MNHDIIHMITLEAIKRIPELIPNDLRRIILFGSCARGDYTEESDIDIAVLLACKRKEAAKYKKELVNLSAELDLKNMVVVNFTCIPFSEFIEKKGYYPFYANIEREGKIIYG